MSEKCARWFFDCHAWKPNLSEMLTVISGIQNEEKERIGKFVFQKDAKSSLAGRLLMRKFVADSSGKSWDDIKLTRDANNKPIYDQTFNFNISHNLRYTILAGQVGECNIGCDVMKMEYSGGKDVSEFFRLMNRYFTSDEWLSITDSCEEQKQVETFYRLWSLKESYVKATGIGITFDLRELNFKLNSEIHSQEFVTDTELFVRGQKSDWIFQEILLPGNYCACVAISKKYDFPSKFTEIKLQDFLDVIKPITPFDETYCASFLNKE